MGRDRGRRRKGPHRPLASRADHVHSRTSRPDAASPLTRLACYTWAAPTTLVGLIAGTIVLGTGGRVHHRRGALEFHGGFARWFADRIGFNAMTLGHVILGRDARCLEMLRDHEQAHVQQAERWGPAFIPAYLAASMLAWSRGGHYYRDNWFERDARRACGDRE